MIAGLAAVVPLGAVVLDAAALGAAAPVALDAAGRVATSTELLAVGTALLAVVATVVPVPVGISVALLPPQAASSIGRIRIQSANEVARIRAFPPGIDPMMMVSS